MWCLSRVRVPSLPSLKVPAIGSFHKPCAWATVRGTGPFVAQTRGRNWWQPIANETAVKTAQRSEHHCRALPPLAASDPRPFVVCDLAPGRSSGKHSFDSLVQLGLVRVARLARFLPRMRVGLRAEHPCRTGCELSSTSARLATS